MLSNYSFISWSTKIEPFAAMFIDSTIAKQFSLGKTKCAYYLTYRMAPYFKDFFCRISKRFHFTLSLLISQTVMFSGKEKWICTSDIGTMKKESVDVHYLNSSLLEKSAAVDVFEHFNSCVESIEKKTNKIF